jgi:photosystem II stability/assembly factor-like uncharacterized protein
MTQDGGRTWTEIESDIWDNIRGLYFASDQEGWAVGDRGLITHRKRRQNLGTSEKRMVVHIN